MDTHTQGHMTPGPHTDPHATAQLIWASRPQTASRTGTRGRVAGQGQVGVGGGGWGWDRVSILPTWYIAGQTRPGRPTKWPRGPRWLGPAGKAVPGSRARAGVLSCQKTFLPRSTSRFLSSGSTRNLAPEMTCCAPSWDVTVSCGSWTDSVAVTLLPSAAVATVTGVDSGVSSMTVSKAARSCAS